MLSHLMLGACRLGPGEEMPGLAEAWLFLHLREGFAYWLGPEQAVELSVGSLLVVGPDGRGTVRASQVNGCLFRLFSVRLDALGGVLTVDETEASRGIVRHVPNGAWLFPADHPVVRELATVPDASGRELRWRVRLLGVAVDVLGPLLQLGAAEGSATAPTASDRFRRLLRETPERELLNLSPEEMADQCRCSVRHLNRLFRQTFGTGLRSKWQELKSRHEPEAAAGPKRDGR